MADGKTIDEEVRQLIIDFLYNVVTKNNRKRGLFLNGEGGNGKSMLIELSSRFVDENAITYLNLEQLGHDFQAATLSADTTLILGDENDTNMSFGGKAMTKAKQIITGANQTFNPKGQPPFTAYIKATVIQASNSDIVFREHNHANKRRWVIIYYKGHVDVKKILDERGLSDFDLEVALDNDEFVAALLLYVLMHANKDKEMIIPAKIEDQTNQMINASDHVKNFVNDMIEQQSIGYDEILPVNHVYDAYQVFLSEESPAAKPMSRQAFTPRITNELANHGYELDLNRISMSRLSHLKFDRQLATVVVTSRGKAKIDYTNPDEIKKLKRTSAFVNHSLEIPQSKVNEIKSDIDSGKEVDLNDPIVIRVIRHLVHDKQDRILASKFFDEL